MQYRMGKVWEKLLQVLNIRCQSAFTAVHAAFWIPKRLKRAAGNEVHRQPERSGAAFRHPEYPVGGKSGSFVLRWDEKQEIIPVICPVTFSLFHR